MTLGLLHQVGHNSNWNIDSFEDESCGDGLILSPLHQNMAAVKRLSQETRVASIFDPQFYLPSSRKPKLLTYPFFPEVVDGGFQTTTFIAHSAAVAQACIKFQVEHGFRKVVVPTRFLNQMYRDYFDRQRRFTVDAFMEAAGNIPVCLSVAITSSMIEDNIFRTQLLNWITSYPNVDEVYLMYQHERDAKQIHDSTFLSGCLAFFTDVMDTGLRLTVGYTNTEGLIFTAAGDLTITMGSFENTRIFSVDKFLESEGERRGPKARIYLAGLFNWVQFEEAKVIRSKAPDIWNAVYMATSWADEALELAVEPTFNQPQLYKHFFKNMDCQVAELRTYSPTGRAALLRQKLDEAGTWYRKLDELGIQFERHGRGTHIAAWRRALDGR